MGVIKLNGKVFGGGGGGGNANIIELTQAEYDALPESKLTDGILYCITDGDGDVINFVSGVYVNPDNLIVSETTFRYEMSYTATQDCIVCMYLVCLRNASTYIKIDNKTVQNYWQSQMVTTASAPIYVKKGQTLTVSGADRDYDSTYWVYGVQTGSVSNAQHNYSTSEQVIGTWVDGKPLYEKTIVYTPSGTISSNTTIANVPNAKVMRVTEATAYNPSENRGYALPDVRANGGTKFTYDDGDVTLEIIGDSWSSSWTFYVTIQYTKTTD